MEKIKKSLMNRKTNYIIVFFTVLLIQLLLGLYLQRNDYWTNVLYSIIIFSIIFFFAFVKEKKINRKEDSKLYIFFKEHKKILSFFIILLAYIPELLAFAPTILNYDGPMEILGRINAYQPLIYTFFLRLFYYTGLLFNSASAGMMVFSITQTIVIAYIYSLTIEFIDNEFKNKYITIGTLAFYALFPYNKIFPMMTTKECMFAGMCLLYVIQTIDLLKSKNLNKTKPTNYIFTTAMMLLLRKNCVYALIVTIPFIIVLTKKEKRKEIIKFTIISIISYLIINNSLILIVNPKRDKVNEKLSVISQGIARISKEKKNELSEEETEKINYYFGDINILSKSYDEIIADNSKALINENRVKNNSIDFYKFTFKTLLKYPNISLKAYLLNMKGYWYLFDDSFCTIHKNDDKRKDNFGALEIYTYNNTDDPELIVKEYNLIPSIKKMYKDMFCLNYYRKIPGLYIVFQPAFYFYLIVGFLLYCLYKKEKSGLLIGTFLILYFLTCFLGPCAIIRYIYNIIVTTPILIGYLLKRENYEANYEKNRK